MENVLQNVLSWLLAEGVFAGVIVILSFAAMLILLTLQVKDFFALRAMSAYHKGVRERARGYFRK